MSLISARPRLLPPTIAAMALLLGVKSVALVRAAIPAGAGSAASSVAVAASKPQPAPVAAPAPPAPTSHTPPPSAVPAPAPDGSDTRAVPGCPPPDPAAAPVTDSERALLLDLRARRTELEAREAALNARAAVQDAAEKRLTVRANELAALQQRLEALEAARHDRDETNWRGLVKVYESMRPRDAAVIFNDLDLPVLLQVMDRMKEAKAAPILAAMQPERARLLTAELAQLRERATSIQPSGKMAPGETQR